MQFLVEIEWEDPVATRVQRLLEALPAGIDQLDRQLPLATERGFVVVNAANRTALDAFAQAANHAGADVKIIP